MAGKQDGAVMTAREREVQALELRKAGVSYRQIGAHLGCSHQAAHDAVMRVLSRFAAQSEKMTRELRQLEVERLDIAVLAVMPLVRQGDLTAVDRLIRLVDARARLLGLNAPAQVEVGGMADAAPIRAEIVSVDVDAFNREFAFLLGVGDGADDSAGDDSDE